MSEACSLHGVTLYLHFFIEAKHCNEEDIFISRSQITRVVQMKTANMKKREKV
jgi:hypothetical protein